ncbi:hypothetical protein [Kineothrix sp. MB12-C1]|uniref:hypothetical protein n=1 Tax=Kineothrix sp. MB12-C1 TaxID=3070215 RepID=UPI0027D29467|nr:hypothetical protein [Kineothrix sp. MB12-C1]WMC91248.1 hypothetical protein RBB56_10160 [Kineothrix sp. MB12-C1]
MEDRYLYKAKRVDNGEWVAGNRIDDGVTGQVFIHAVGNSVNESDKVGEEGCVRFLALEIDPATLCQCTGETGLYEHDIFHLGDEKILYEVVWRDTGFMGKQLKSSSYAGLSYWHDRIVKMGNRIDNPELLEV